MTRFLFLALAVLCAFASFQGCERQPYVLSPGSSSDTLIVGEDCDTVFVDVPGDTVVVIDFINCPQDCNSSLSFGIRDAFDLEEAYDAINSYFICLDRATPTFYDEMVVPCPDVGDDDDDDDDDRPCRRRHKHNKRCRR